ncbi:NUDIX hydrolase N-terminal domain-containing protein, partial [Pseudomonas aeruginosa]
MEPSLRHANLGYAHVLESDGRNQGLMNHYWRAQAYEEDAGNTWLKTSSTDHRAARVLSMAQPLDGSHDADHPKAEKTEGKVPSVSDPRALAHLLELILSTAQAGLAFSKDRFDIGRFRALQHAVAEFIASDQGVAYERVENWIA